MRWYLSLLYWPTSETYWQCLQWLSNQCDVTCHSYIEWPLRHVICNDWGNQCDGMCHSYTDCPLRYSDSVFIYWVINVVSHVVSILTDLWDMMMSSVTRNQCDFTIHLCIGWPVRPISSNDVKACNDCQIKCYDKFCSTDLWHMVVRPIMKVTSNDGEINVMTHSSSILTLTSVVV